jgi:hypothetical protein
MAGKHLADVLADLGYTAPARLSQNVENVQAVERSASERRGNASTPEAFPSPSGSASGRCAERLDEEGA